MHLLSLLVVITFIGNIENVELEDVENPGSDENGNHETNTTGITEGDHTFVALLDIVFTDNSKRTCTGAIIHDYVVVTAAHCFTCQKNPSAMPELTTSFVVIGTKKMFDTGYEQYLPIERVLTHPKFSGWTADLSLVYTFAGMTSDKPGTIIPLAGVKTSTHVDANVTVFSWGHMKDIDSKLDGFSTKHEKCSESESHEDIQDEEFQNESDEVKVTVMRSKIQHQSNYEVTPVTYKTGNTFRKQRNTLSTQKRAIKKTHKLLGPLKTSSQNTKLISRYLSEEELETDKSIHSHRHRAAKNNDYEQPDKEERMVYDEETDTVKPTHSHRQRKNKEDLMVYDDETTESIQDILNKNHSTVIPEPELNSFQSFYKNWRRQMGSQQNQLTVEVFGFVNVQACKKMVEKAMPAEYDISDGNDVVCYATEDHFISDEDSGAPAVRRGQLVAVTAGGAEIDGDHVAVGMKMSCYCTWISENLPSGGDKFNCCKSCCDVKHKEAVEVANKRINKYLF